MGGIDQRRKCIVLENVLGLISKRRMSKSLRPMERKTKQEGETVQDIHASDCKMFGAKEKV